MYKEPLTFLRKTLQELTCLDFAEEEEVVVVVVVVVVVIIIIYIYIHRRTSSLFDGY
jgi:hypothetical protein